MLLSKCNKDIDVVREMVCSILHEGQETVQATPVRLGMRGREVKIMVAYSSLTFALQTKNGSVTVSSPWVKEAMIAAQATNSEGNT